MAAQIAKAEEHIKEAKKHMKTGLLKWQPNVDMAVIEYQNAALLFRQAKSLDRCLNCHEQCGELLLQDGHYFHAAKSFEQAAICYKDMNNIPKFVEAVRKSVNLLRRAGDLDTTTLMLDRNAKILVESQPETAIEFWMQAADIAETEEKNNQAIEYCEQMAKAYLTMDKYDDAYNALQKEYSLLTSIQSHSVAAKCIIGMVLIKLKLGDDVGAEKIWSGAVSGGHKSQDINILEALLCAYQERDNEKIVLALSQPTFLYLDNAYAKMARDIKREKEAAVKRQQQQGSGEAPPPRGINPPSASTADDQRPPPPDDDDVDLC